jgi:hypothetical protein
VRPGKTIKAAKFRHNMQETSGNMRTFIIYLFLIFCFRQFQRDFKVSMKSKKKNFTSDELPVWAALLCRIFVV